MRSGIAIVMLENSQWSHLGQCRYNQSVQDLMLRYIYVILKASEVSLM